MPRVQSCQETATYRSIVAYWPTVWIDGIIADRIE